MAVGAALVAVAAYAATPLAALLPLLGQTLAAGRHRERIGRALAQIEMMLQAHEDELRALTDEQYKFVNEVILTTLQTTSGAKIGLLRNAIENGISDCSMQPHDAIFLSRAIRDMSAEEAQFLIDNFGYERIQLADADVEHEMKVLGVAPTSKDGQLVLGLSTLGLLMPAEPTWDDTGLLRFSPYVSKLLALLRPPGA
ncbi:MAG: hypothetical protein ABIP61_01680 [Burkholderiaceae bacterium]